jgi:lipoate-protein ligase A
VTEPQPPPRAGRTRVRLLDDDGTRDPRRNLALEEAIARSPGPHPTLRLWRNDRAVVVGRFQLAAAEVDLAAAREAETPVLRRFTGGGAVYHDPGNLNVSLVLVRDRPPLAGRLELVALPTLYRLLLEPLAAAVGSLGLAVERTERDLLVAGRKISGVAAWLGRDRVLVHATLLVSADLALLERLLRGPGAPGDPRWERTRSRRMPVTSLGLALGRVPSAAELTGCLVGAFAAAYGFELVASRPSEEERALADELLGARYAREAWHAD